jgi:hypothetical protein
MSKQTKTTTRYTVEVATIWQRDRDPEGIDSQEVLSTTVGEALAKAYMECDNAYVQVYGPSVAKWMRVRLVNEHTGERSKWYTLNDLRKVAA